VEPVGRIPLFRDVRLSRSGCMPSVLSPLRPDLIQRWADVALTIAATVTTLAFCAFVYRYGWFERSFALPDLLGAFGLMLFATLRLRPGVRRSIALSGMACAALLFGAELALAMSKSGRPPASAPFWNLDAASPTIKREIASLNAGLRPPIDARDRHEVLAGLRGRGIDAVSAVMLGPLVDNVAGASRAANGPALMPLSGVSNALTVLCNEAGQFVSYESDEHGFRNPKGLWSSGRADVAVVGQSFAQGYCVPDGKGFVDLLRRDYPKTLNLGMSGGSSLLPLAAMKEYLPRYAPKAVLWVYSEGVDLQPQHSEVRPPLLVRYLDPGFTQHLIERQTEIDTRLRRFLTDVETRKHEVPSNVSIVKNWSMSTLKLWNLRGTLHLEPPADNRESLRLLDVLAETLPQAQNVTRSWGGTLYFVFLPSWSRYHNGPGVFDPERRRVLSLVTKLGIPIIDAQPAFDADNDPLALFPFRRFGHYDERGYELVAEQVLSALAPAASPEASARLTESATRLSRP
jgi:hypothetical protein